jgi:hypothetical protein
LIHVICEVYLDDIIIYSTTLAEHIEHVRIIMERLQKHNLKIKIEKCKFAQETISYLSHTISYGNISPSSAKVDRLLQFKSPLTARQIHSFLGLASYYRRFVKNFASLVSPLLRAAQEKYITWTQECQVAYELVLNLLTNEPILKLPRFIQPFVLETDACNYGVGAVLAQLRDAYWHPVAYFSKHLSKQERNYSTSEKELFAIVLAMEHFRQFYPCEIVTADMMGPLPRSSQQNEYALVICDHFTKWIEIHAMRNGTEVEVAKRLIKFFTRFGLPDQILTDQGTNFQSNVLAEVNDAFDIHKTRTSPYHPQCDGQTERFMRTLKMMISSYIDDKQRNWDVHLDLFSFAYNTATHATTKYSPFYIVTHLQKMDELCRHFDTVLQQIESRRNILIEPRRPPRPDDDDTIVFIQLVDQTDTICSFTCSTITAFMTSTQKRSSPFTISDF